MTPQDMLVTKCKFHDKGYCKFGEKCRFQHYSVICDKLKCPNKHCEKRHPRTCRFFFEENYCKFGSYCFFRHEDPLLAKIKSLEDTLAEKESKIKLLEEVIGELKVKQNDLNNSEENDCQENHEDINDIDTEKIQNKFKCDKCGFEAKSKSGLKIHMKVKHKNIVQIDGIDDIDSEIESDESKFLLNIDASPECNDSDIKESIECNFFGALDDNKIIDKEKRDITIERLNNEESEDTNNYYIICVKNSLEVIEALKYQFDNENYDSSCFSKAVSGKIYVDCISIEDI